VTLSTRASFVLLSIIMLNFTYKPFMLIVVMLNIVAPRNYLDYSSTTSLSMLVLCVRVGLMPTQVMQFYVVLTAPDLTYKY
jgi:hypothetical protein